MESVAALFVAMFADGTFLVPLLQYIRDHKKSESPPVTTNHIKGEDSF
ncbi:MAG TPA: hypothetical protein VNM69_18195 [Bacillus sp. (in: firmicutes)]|nr:hypothetical protein [Bacillus sp. (in: firmicutes)]